MAHKFSIFFLSLSIVSSHCMAGVSRVRTSWHRMQMKKKLPRIYFLPTKIFMNKYSFHKSCCARLYRLHCSPNIGLFMFYESELKFRRRYRLYSTEAFGKLRIWNGWHGFQRLILQINNIECRRYVRWMPRSTKVLRNRQFCHLLTIASDHMKIVASTSLRKGSTKFHQNLMHRSKVMTVPQMVPCNQNHSVFGVSACSESQPNNIG